ncbi:cytochrome P450 [Allokutzneria oryzae]|uniref:Cytochrome P450 n=1 Tax=Allokutzneria oryzae TaxID=1378989 RepID=A0ABV5ZU10_9PSEU
MTQAYPFSPAQRLEMDPTYAWLRDNEPVTRVRMPYGNGTAWLVTRYDDVKAALSDLRLSRAAAVGKDVPRSRPELEEPMSVLSADPPEHSRLRRLAAKAFNARQMERMRPKVDAIVAALLDEMATGGSTADLARALCWPMPTQVICELLGVPYADTERIRAWVTHLVAMDSTDITVVKQARTSVWTYFVELIARRRAEPADDLLSHLIAARDEGDRLSENELISFGITLLVAGYETTANSLGNFVFHLLANRHLWQRLLDEPEILPAATEEMLRALPIAATGLFTRIATADLELGGVLIREGDAVVLQPTSANRDASVFERPDEVDFDREVNPHIAFGFGTHYCIGAQLARLELTSALSALLRRFPALRLAVPALDVPWRAGQLVRGVESLPVTWTEGRG